MAGYDAAELQALAGPLEVKFKGGAFATWSDVFVRLEGRWLAVHRRERDATRLGAVELGPGVRVTDLLDPEAAAKFPRRLDVSCRGGLLPKTELNFRAKSRKDRDIWASAIAANLCILSSAPARDPRWGVQDLEPLVVRMLQSLPLHSIRIRSDRSVRCATGEAIVSFLKTEGIVSDRAQATQLGRRLLAMNLLHHVVWEKDFSDSPEPYVLVDTQALALGGADEDAVALAMADATYEVEHFLKYMDARKFWKYFDSPDNRDGDGEREVISSTSTSRSGGSVRSGSGRSTRAGGSSERSERSVSSSRNGSTFVETPRDPMLPPSTCHSGNGSSSSIMSGLSGLPPPALGTDDAARRFSTLSVSTSGLTTPDSVLDVPQTAAGAEKKAKKCAVCTKSFNPLRRRHNCRSCGAVVCSSCSVVRKARGGSHAAAKNAFALSSDSLVADKDAEVGHTRICISCKLNATSSVGSEPDDLSDRMRSDLELSQRSTRLETTGSANELSLSQRSLASQSSQPPTGGLRRLSSGRRPSQPQNGVNGVHCHYCADRRCVPLQERSQIPYAVEPQSPDATGMDHYVAAQPLEKDEETRLKTVQTLVETMAATPSAERVLVQFCHMAAIASQSSVAFVGLLGRDEFLLRAQHGLGAVACPATLPRQQSLAAHTCRNDAPLVCSDLKRDVRFRENPWRRDGLCGAAFYAGVPLTLANGQTVGALEVFDSKPRFECGEVVEQLQAVVRGLLKLFEDILAAAEQARLEEEQEKRQEQEQEQEKPAENAMEAQLLQLLSQTTSTQEQLRNQQGQMVHAISSHSKQISELAKQLERMESTLAAKLGE